MAMPAAFNPWDQLTPPQQASLAARLGLLAPNTGGAGAPLPTPMQQRLGPSGVLPPGYGPNAGQPFAAITPNHNLDYLDAPAGALAQPLAQKQAAQAFPPPAGAANAGQPDATPPAGLPLYLPKQTIQEKKAAAQAAAPASPWQDPHATTSPGGGKNPQDYVGQVDAGNPNGGMPPSDGASSARGQLADAFGIPGMGMLNPRAMFKPGQMAPRGTAPINPLQAAGSAPSLADLGKNPAAIAQQQQAALTTAMPELHNQNYLQPISPMELKGEKSEGTAAQKSDVGAQTSRVIPQTEFDQAMARLEAGTPGLQMERQDLSSLHDVLGNLLTREQGVTGMGRVDLSPLMALSDTWFGGNLSKGYQAPLNRLQTIANVAKTLTGGEGALSQHEIDFLRTQLQDKLMTDLATNLGGSRTVQVGMGGGGAGMMNPIELMRLGEEFRQHRIQNDRTDAAAAGKFADAGGTSYAEVQRALAGIDKIAHDHNSYNTNELPGFYGNFHNPTPFFKDEEGKDLDRYLAVLTNQINHMDFGSRVTNTEMQAQARNLATAQGQGPKQILKALRDYAAAVQRQRTAEFGAMTPDQQARVKASGALLPKDFNFTFGAELPAAKPQKRAQVRSGGDTPADDAMLPHVRPKNKPDAPDIPASQVLRQGGAAGANQEPSVDELRRQAKARAAALSGGK